MSTPSPKDDVDSRRARLRQRLGQIAPAATHEYVEVAAQWHPVDPGSWRDAPLAPPPPARSPQWAALAPGEPWGSPEQLLVWGYPADGGSVGWLRAHLDVPAGWAGDDALLGLDDARLGNDRAAVDGIGFEARVHLDVDGTPVVLAGMDDPPRAVLLPQRVTGHGVDVLLRCTTAARRPFAGLRLLRRHRDTFALGVLAHTLLGVADALPDGDVTATALYAALDTAYATLDLRSGWNSEPLRHSASRALAQLRSAVPPGHASGDRPLVVASGHAHLDVAWLWPVWRTRQKVAHTVATALNLMDHYPDYHFSLAAPQTWQFLRGDVPELYARVRERAREGRLEPVGVFWLESDGNLPSGESFVRQIRHGIAFYRRELGTVPNAAWLPDSFGFTAALPAILNGFGVRTLLTTKLSWNRVNRMPADTFRWRSPDGSEILAHFVTTTSHPAGHPTDPVAHTYAGNMSPAEVAGLWANYRGKQVSPEVLYLYGHGDGGGGPTEEMVAAAAVMADLPGFPQVSLGRAAEFFDRLHARADDHPRLPTWTGDLYFEMHRGTLTSQQRTKRANRDGELALREAEWLNAWVVASGGTDRQAQLDRAWETLLRNQFHDILPGSSIPQVYVDATAEHEALQDVAAGVRDEAFGELLPDPNDEVVLNSLPWARTGLIARPDGSLIPVSAPSYGWAAITVADNAATAPAPAGTCTVRVEGAGWVLENAVLRAVLDHHGELLSLREKASGLEALAGPSNRLVLFEDRPLHWDAWDVDAFYPDKAVPLDGVDSVELLDSWHGLRAGLRISRSSGATRVVQTLTLDQGSGRLDVATEVDWQERQMLLRALFPFSPNASHATLGRQFGSVELPVHRNTSWEQARFEVAAHGWLDVSDGGGGVALLTDALYGHSAIERPGGGVDVGVSLLKSGAWPDPQADRGRHVLRYALAPHAGTWQQAAVPQQALDLAVPLTVRLGVAPQPRSLLSVTSAPITSAPVASAPDGADDVIAETVKAAWDGDGLVVRLYEAHNRCGTVTLQLDRPIRAAALATLDEVDLSPLEVSGSSVTLPIRPHQLVTVRLRF